MGKQQKREDSSNEKLIQDIHNYYESFLGKPLTISFYLIDPQEHGETYLNFTIEKSGYLLIHFMGVANYPDGFLSLQSVKIFS
jgi:hypothetical protein